MRLEIHIPSAPNCGATATVTLEDGHVIARLRDERWDLGAGDETQAAMIAAAWRNDLTDFPPIPPKPVDPYTAKVAVGPFIQDCVVVAELVERTHYKFDPNFRYGYVVRINGTLVPVRGYQIRNAS